MMAVRPRLGIGTVDLGNVKGVVEEVVVENEELYDMTYNTMIDAFADKPLSGQELADVLARIDLEIIAGLILIDPTATTEIMKAKREAL